VTAELFVVGAGGFGRETLDVIAAINRASDSFRVLGVVDDSPSAVNLGRLEASGSAWLGTAAEVIATHAPAGYALAIGDPTARRTVAGAFEAAGWQAVTLIHPAAVLGSVAAIGAGCIICGGVQLSTNTRLGRFVQLNPNATIGHDTDLGDFVSVNPAAVVSGEVRIDPEVLVGAGAVILQGLTVGSGSTIGAAACVTKPVPSNAVAKGVPARWA